MPVSATAEVSKMGKLKIIAIDYDGWTINNKTLEEYTKEELAELQHKLLVVRWAILTTIEVKGFSKVKPETETQRG